ncbi:hypothetical protein BH11ARM2_BH11ARM2_19180 [soil metagenome]
MSRILALVVAALFCGVLLSYGVTQEVPIGQLKGSVTMQENRLALEGALVSLSLIGQPDDERPRVRGVETDEKGQFAFRNLPAGEYRLEVSAKEHAATVKRITIEEGKTRETKLAAKPSDPYLNLYASQKVFTPNETPRIEIHGFVPEKDVRLALYRLDMDKVAAKGGYQSAIGPLANPDAAGNAGLDKAGEKVVDLAQVVKERDAEGAFVETLPVGKLKEGVYFVRSSAGKTQASTVLLVSQLALITKTGKDGTLCYTADIATGQPTGGAEIFAKAGDGLKKVGTTDKEGILQVAKISGNDDNQSLLMARKGESTALVGFYNDTSQTSDVWIKAYCERPAYRPGDTVSFKGFARRVDGEGYRLPGEGTMEVEVHDPDGNPIQKMNVPVSVHGGFSGTFTTSPESKPGAYNLICKAYGGESRGVYANVVAYRKPEFSITVTPGKDHFVMGDKASATVECKYYYGGPVVGAKVKVNVYRSPAYTYTNEDDETEEVDSYDGGEYSEDLTAVTDASGRATIEFDTRGDNDPDVFTNDYVYNVYASVTEDDSKYFDGEGKVRVTRGDFNLAMEVQNPILAKGDTADLLVRTTDPLDGKKPSPNHQVEIQAGREEWTQGASVFISKETYPATTGADGTAHVAIPITRDESLSLRAVSKDADGHEVVANAWAYVVGSPAEAEGAKGDLKITLDKKHYENGERAKALLQTDMPGGTALVTVQTDRILWRELVPLTSGSTLVEVPVKQEYAPNVYVSVAYTRSKKFLQAEKRLKVEREDRKLKIAVSSDKETYKPGETAKVTVRTVDANGKPVPADVSVGVVDRGIYDIAEDQTDLYGDLYPERSNGVQTAYSFPEIYLDGGDKGSANIPIRTNFKDTADWVPSVWTGPNGEAEVSVVLPDNLTEWRITVIGLSDTSQAGKATGSFRVKKDLMLRLGLPQFLIDGDRQRMTVVVANDTGQDQDVHVALDVAGMSMEGEKERTLRVPSGQPQTVDLMAVAGDPGQASVTAKAWIDNGPTDGVKQSFAIHPHGRPTLETRAGEGTASVTFPAGKSLDPKEGELTINLSPTLAGDLVKALDGLIDFPYGCTEQTMSRFLPSILVEQTVRQLGLPRPKNLENLPKITRDSLTRLSRMQHGDGGWGWWEYDASEPFMTALVLDGLDRARRAGVDVSTVQTNRALEWSLNYLKNKENKPEAREKLYLVYALLKWGKPEAGTYLDGVNLKDRTEKVFDIKLQRPTAAELATAALAYQAAGRDANGLLDRLAKRAQIGEEIVTWAPEDGAWGDEPTALALTAFETIRPGDPRIPKIVQGLMRSRKGDSWTSTRDTAYSIIGLTAYLNRTKELSTASTAMVMVNGKARGTISLDPNVLDDPARTIHVPRSELGTGPVKVEIRKSGAGKCYYSLSLSGLEVADPLEATATDKGLRLVRRFYKLEPRRLENGEMRLLPSKAPVTDFANGDLVRVELTINSDVPREFVMVEEPTPSSCRVNERTDLDNGDEKGWWWSQTVVMDDHLAFFARNLPKGESKISYNMRAEQAGKASALPGTVRNMYDPGRWASAAEAKIEVAK